MSQKKLGAVLATLALITACSSPAEPEPAPEGTASTTAQEQATPDQEESSTPDITDEELYESDLDGSTGNSWEIDPTKKLAFVSQQNAVGVIEEMKEPADFAALRKRTEDDTDMLFYRVSVDNRKGHEDVDIDSMQGYDANGAQYDFIPLHQLLEQASTDSDLDRYEDDQHTLMDTISDLTDRYVQRVPRRGVADVVLVTKDLPLPKRFVKLMIVPYLSEEEAVVHSSDIGEDDMLSFEVPAKHRR